MSTEGKEDVGNGKKWNVDMERWTNIISLLVFNIFCVPAVLLLLFCLCICLKTELRAHIPDVHPLLNVCQ